MGTVRGGNSRVRSLLLVAVLCMLVFALQGFVGMDDRIVWDGGASWFDGH